jgi:hypothetical protein
MNASDPNLDALIKAAARDLLDEDLELFHSIDTSKTIMSDKAVKKIRKKIRNYDRESWWSSVPLACRRAVAAVLIICSMSFVFSMSVTAVRAEIVNTVMMWYDKFVSVFYVTDKTPPSTIEMYREPSLQLADTEKQVIQQSLTDYIVFYFMDGKPVMMYQQMIIGENTVKLDSENCVVTEIKIKDNYAQLFDYDDGSKAITWHDYQYAYIIKAEPYDYKIDLLISIAESIE